MSGLGFNAQQASKTLHALLHAKQAHALLQARVESDSVILYGYREPIRILLYDDRISVACECLTQLLSASCTTR